jgi:hypothetical protein
MPNFKGRPGEFATDTACLDGQWRRNHHEHGLMPPISRGENQAVRQRHDDNVNCARLLAVVLVVLQGLWAPKRGWVAGMHPWIDMATCIIWALPLFVQLDPS